VPNIAADARSQAIPGVGHVPDHPHIVLVALASQRPAFAAVELIGTLDLRRLRDGVLDLRDHSARLVADCISADVDPLRHGPLGACTGSIVIVV
jgi:hypothetical protein